MLQKLKCRMTQKRRLRLQTRLLCIYVVGGLIPMLFTCLYLIRGTQRILIDQTRNSEYVEIQNTKRQILESLNTIAAVSRYFYFDEDLEHIAFNTYRNYQEIVDDYKNYTAFQTYENYYNQVIRWMCMYIDNPSISGNARFVKVQEDYRNAGWYQKALQDRGRISWNYMSNSTGQEEFLSLVRLIRSESQRNVGVLVVHIRPEWLKEVLEAREGMTYLYLDGETLIGVNGGSVDTELIREDIRGMDGDSLSMDVRYDGVDYLLSAVNVKLPESENTLQVVGLQASSLVLRAAKQQARQSRLFMLAGVVIALAMIAGLSHGFSRRVNCFREQMQKAASGNFDLQRDLGGNDEISDLYSYLGDMIYSIQKLLSQIYQEQLQKEKLKTRQKDAEFKMLASQINPHFLYNTLETIRMTARNNGQYDIENLVKMLAKLLRRNIQAGNRPVTIRSEMELLEYYLKIQQYRFGERIQYEVQIEDWMDDLRILPLLMQPIVENAIIHGLESKEGTGHLTVAAARWEHKIRIAVTDDGAGIAPERLAEIRADLENMEELDNTHIGICNVHQRIKLMYGEAYGLTVQSEVKTGTRVEIVIPETHEC